MAFNILRGIRNYKSVPNQDEKILEGGDALALVAAERFLFVMDTGYSHSRTMILTIGYNLFKELFIGRLMREGSKSTSPVNPFVDRWSLLGAKKEAKYKLFEEQFLSGKSMLNPFQEFKGQSMTREFTKYPKVPNYNDVMFQRSFGYP